MSFSGLHAIANVFNFLLFAIILAKFVGPIVAKDVGKRRKVVLDALADAAEINRQAIASLQETRDRLANVSTELATLLSDARRIGAMQAAAVEEQGVLEAERLRLSAKAEIERERQAAVQEIRELLMRQAFERAARELQQGVTPERQRELVGAMIQKVGDGSLALR